jgi:hypothetical protein
MPNLIAVWLLFYCLAWLCWALAAPIIADAAKVPAREQHICPMLVISHGIGADLKTFTRVRDICQQ